MKISIQLHNNKTSVDENIKICERNFFQIYLPPSRPLRFFLELLLLEPLPPPLAFVGFGELLSLLFQRINILTKRLPGYKA